MKRMNGYALILAGGASSRLFPFNKIMSDLSGTGKTLIQQALMRAATLAPKQHISILAVKESVLPLARQLRLSKKHFFVDPVRRGTWPALMWAMAHLRRQDPNAVVAVLTGDHIIPRLPAFRRAAQRACALAAAQNSVVMLGVEPGHHAAAWTGYGVFRVDGERVTAFAEKPSLAQAEKMRQEGGWQWNSGMFFFRIRTAEQALAIFQPAMRRQYDHLCAAVAQRKMTMAAKLYAEFPAKIPHPLDAARLVDNTIDFAIMTPLVHGRATNTSRDDLTPLAICGGLPIWTDLGQWESLGDVRRLDRRNNIHVGRVRLDRATSGCILAADQGYAIDVRGLTHMAVAVSDRGLLVLSRQELPRIKEHVAQCAPQKFLIVNPSGVRVQRSGRKVVVSGTPFIR